MKIKDLTQIWICSPIKSNSYGESTIVWTYKGSEYLNLQQDLNELDRNNAGEIDYSIYKCRTDKTTTILKGDGIYFTDIHLLTNPKPDYIAKGIIKIGKSTTITINRNI